MKTLALEGAGEGISACAVCPGYVRTPLVENQVAAQAEAHGMPEERVLEEVILAPHAVKRLIEPDEVAETVAFLLGPGGRAFTGSAVSMDSGLDRAVDASANVNCLLGRDGWDFGRAVCRLMGLSYLRTRRSHQAVAFALSHSAT